MQDEYSNINQQQEEVDPMPINCDQNNCPYIDKMTELIERSVRTEEHLLSIKKSLEGNGVPGIITRVNNLEAESIQSKGVAASEAKWDTWKKWIVGTALSIVLAMGAWGITVWANTHKDEAARQMAIQQSLTDNDKRIESKVDGVTQELHKHEAETAPKQRGN